MARRPSVRLRAGSFVVALALLALPGPGATHLAAQDDCEFGDEGNDVVTSQNLPGVGRVTYVTRPHFVCAGGVQIWADSAVAYADTEMFHLIRSVRYTESARELRSDEARYFSIEGRLQAQGNVRLRDDEGGSSIENGDLVYLLETDFRDVAEMTVTTGADGLRPVAFLLPAEREEEPDSAAVVPDSALALDSVPPLDAELPAVDPVEPEGAPPVGPEAPADTTPPTPYRVEGDRLFLRGAGFFTAVGDVEIERDDLLAYGDSAVYDSAGEGLVIEGRARVEGSAYELVGRRVAMSSPDGGDSEIVALREARLVGEEFDLTAARIVAFLVDDALERLVATPIVRRAAGGETPDSADLERPIALIEGFELTSDSLEVLAPDEALQRVFAAGRARSFSTSGDSLNVEVLPEIARTDWLEGDTIIVTFREAAADAETEVDAIVAVVGARSLYRIPPRDSAAVAGTDAPAVHYVTGDSIRIQMRAGEILGMRVAGQTHGVHFEPVRRAARPDSAAAVDSVAAIDTAAVVDTSGVAPGARQATDDGRRDGRGPDSREREQQGEPDDPPFSEEHPWIRH